MNYLLMILRTLIFLVLNFTALAIGSIFTATGVKSEWYITLKKAPWTPPGWVFGFAWTFIMICFALYMASLWKNTEQKKALVALFALQWVLNILWNPLFFKFHQVNIALTVIVLLTVLVAYFLVNYVKQLQVKSLFIVPYLLWLCIATSLNAYISLKNNA